MKFPALATLACMLALGAPQVTTAQGDAADMSGRDLYEACAVGTTGDTKDAEIRRILCAAKMRVVLASDPKIAFDQDSALLLTSFMDDNPHLRQDGVPAIRVIDEMLDHWSRSASKPSTRTGIDWKQAIGTGIIGGGAALAIGLVLLIPRWLWIGIRTDIRRRRNRQSS